MNNTHQQSMIVSAPSSMYHYITLGEELIRSEDYIDEVLLLRTASEGDTIHILINCFGGSMAVMGDFISAMNQCRAHIITEITSHCMSAATLIFLKGHEYRVNTNIEFMAHTGSYGAYGKENNVFEHVDFSRKIIHNTFRESYKYFFTEDEIESILQGEDKYLNAEEVNERLIIKREADEADIDAELGDTFDTSISRDKLLKLSRKDLVDMLIGSEDEGENT